MRCASAHNTAKREKGAEATSAQDRIRREILPIPDIPHVGLTAYDAKDPDTKYPPIEPLRPPKGAPNVLIILLDDVGFGDSPAFGGPCYTPSAEREYAYDDGTVKALQLAPKEGWIVVSMKNDWKTVFP